MDLQTGHRPVAGTETGLKRQLVAATCGVAVGVAVLTGLGASHATSHSNANRTGTASGAAHANGVPGASAAQPLPLVTYYLVGSQEQAERLAASFHADNELSPGYEIVVMRSDADATRTFGAIGAGGNTAGVAEGPPIQIVDLRAP